MASQKLKGGYGLKSKKFKIFVETYYNADVTVDLFETSREKVETNWSYIPSTNFSSVQFPAPIKKKGNEVVMQIRLENLIKDVQKRGFKSLRFYAFGSWIMKIFVPILWNAACSTDVDLYIVLSPLDSEITETKAILQSMECKGDEAGTKLDKILLPVKKATFNLLQYFHDTVNEVKKKGCTVSYDSGNLALAGSKAKECEKIIKKALEVTNNKLSVDTIDNVSQNDSALLSKIQYLKDYKSVLCVFDEDGGLKIYGLNEDSVKNARREIEKSMTPKSTNINTAPSSGSTGSHSKVNTVRSQSSDLHSSLSTKNKRTFYTKENIKVHVYAGNILDLGVDCIVSPTDKDLLHQGAIAREISKRAGDDLKKGCQTYLDEYQQLDVGRACRTSAGRMKYKYVIHTVGPRWKDFQPITEQSLDECGRLLKTAILESLDAANIAPKTMKSIAFPAISAGQLGVPKDFCCVQYGKAVIDYSKTTTSKMEIHFVDLSADMIKMLGDTFDSMINCDKLPIFYNKKAYISTNVTESSMYPWEHQPTFLCEEFDPPEKPTYEKRGANFDGSMLLNRTEKSMTAPPFKIKDQMAARSKEFVKKMSVLPKTGMEMRSTSTIEDVSGVFKLENIRGNLFLITFGSLKPVKFTATSTDVTNKGNILCDGENIYQLIIVNEAIKLIPISEVETFSTAPKSELTDKSLIKPGTTNEEKSKYDELASGSDFVDEG